jgi:hypothetical protein
MSKKLLAPFTLAYPYLIILLVSIYFIGCSNDTQEKTKYPGEDVIKVVYNPLDSNVIRVGGIPYYIGDERSGAGKIKLMFGEPDTVLHFDNMEYLRYHTEGICFGFINDELSFITLNFNNDLVDTTDNISYEFDIDDFIVNDLVSPGTLVIRGWNFDQKEYDENKRIWIGGSKVGVSMQFNDNDKILFAQLLIR